MRRKGGAYEEPHAVMQEAANQERDCRGVEGRPGRKRNLGGYGLPHPSSSDAAQELW